MTGQVYSGFVRQLANGGKAEKLLPPYPLSNDQDIFMGRDATCHIVLDPERYTIVSRRHAAIRPLYSEKNDLPRWEICDLNSVNGTYINGQQLQGCRQLKVGDYIELGEDGPVFIFECQLNNDPTPLHSPQQNNFATQRTPIAPVPTGRAKAHAVTFTQLFPLASMGGNLRHKAFLGPGIITVVFVVLMFAFVEKPTIFNPLLASYLAASAYFFVYRLCGKSKPWWILLLCALATAGILVSPILPLFITFFRKFLPGSLPNQGDEISFASLLMRMFFGAGMMEELLKAIPVLVIYLLGRLFSSPWREKIGIWEPLDGILLGTASAVGFTMLETLGQYVPAIINNTTLQVGDDLAQLRGLQLLIPRILGSVVGHMAYSGYFGYFIGLSAMIPSKALQILGVGYICASVLHALWNATGFISPIILAVVGVLSYAFLASAILKARAISPTRDQNFATRFFRD